MTDRELKNREQQAERVAESQGLRVEKMAGRYGLYDAKTGNSQVPPDPVSGATNVLTLEGLEKALSKCPGLTEPHINPREGPQTLPRWLTDCHWRHFFSSGTHHSAPANGAEESLEEYNNKVKLRDHIRETLRLVEDQAGLLETTPPNKCHQFAAGGLMRCHALLRGICVLEDASLGALAGMLERQLWETWLISLHVLLRGKEALDEVQGADVFHKRRLAKRLNLRPEYQPEWTGPVGKLNHWQLAEDLGPLLDEAGETGGVTTGILAYDVTYRVQSLFSVHAGIATIRPYIRFGQRSWSVEPNPSAPFDDIGLVPALYTLHLANYVFKRFGIATDAVEAAYDDLQAFAKLAGAIPST